MGSSLNVSTFNRLVGEDEMLLGWLVDGPFFVPTLGVLTSSVFMVLYPLRVTVCTTLSSRKVPFALIFFGLEENDIERTWETFCQNRQQLDLLAESPYGNSFV